MATITLCFFLFFSFIYGQEGDVDPITGCSKLFPHFSVGDLNLTSSNYESYTKEHPVFVLGVSNSTCEECCYFEPMLHLLHDLISTKHLYKGQPIPLARLDVYLAQKESFALDIPLEGYFPKILVYKDGTYYVYISYQHYPLVLYFISRVLNPVVQLNTSREVETFLDADKECPDWTEFYQWGAEYTEIGRGILPPKLVRVVGILEREEDVKEITGAAQAMAEREDLRVGIIQSQETINKLKKSHPEWFKAKTTSFLLLKRTGDPTVETLELPSQNITIFQWINERSMGPLEEMNEFTFPIYSTFRTPIFLAVFPITLDKLEEGTKIFEALQKASQKHKEHMYFTYTNASSKWTQEQNFSVSKIPGAALLFPGDTSIPYPQDWPLDFTYIDKFCKLYSETKRPTFPKKFPNYASTSYKALAKVPILTPANFTFPEKDCTLLFLFNSLEETDLQAELARKVNRIAEIISDVQVKEIFVYGYDFSVDPYPLKDPSLGPHILFKCGTDNISKYTGKPTAVDLLSFVSEKSKGRLKFNKEMVTKSGKDLYDFYVYEVTMKRKTDL